MTEIDEPEAIEAVQTRDSPGTELSISRIIPGFVSGLKEE